MILPYLDAETMLARGGRWLRFLRRKQDQAILLFHGTLKQFL